MHDFLGSGWAFPPRVDARGRIALARQEQDVEEAIHMILLTPKGQRVMRPEFGCRIHDLVFSPNDSTVIGLASYYVEEALSMWEPRIDLREVEVTAGASDRGELFIRVSYSLKGEHDSRSLVYPYYLLPG